LQYVSLLKYIIDSHIVSFKLYALKAIGSFKT